MGRVTGMPFVYYDKQKKRYFVERRAPEDVQPIIGKAKVKHRFPQSVDHATAYDLSFHVIRRWEAKWNRVRPQPKRIQWLDDGSTRLGRTNRGRSPGDSACS
jgi:hypothetical protein